MEEGGGEGSVRVGWASIPEEPEATVPGEMARSQARLAKRWHCGPTQAGGTRRGWPGPAAVGREHGSGAHPHQEKAGPRRRKRRDRVGKQRLKQAPNPSSRPAGSVLARFVKEVISCLNLEIQDACLFPIK